jgi:hypothetical protein
MNKEIHPAVFVGGIVGAIVIILVVLFKLTTGPGSIPPGGVGNAGPFERGVVGKGASEGKTRVSPPSIPGRR